MIINNKLWRFRNIFPIVILVKNNTPLDQIPNLNKADVGLQYFKFVPGHENNQSIMSLRFCPLFIIKLPACLRVSDNIVSVDVKSPLLKN